MIDKFGFGMLTDPALFGAAAARLSARRVARSADLLHGVLAPLVARRAGPGAVAARTAIVLRERVPVDFVLVKRSPFSRRAIRITSDADGHVTLAAEKRPRGWKLDREAYLRFLFLASFAGDADAHEVAYAAKRVRIELFAGLVGAGVAADGAPEGLAPAVVANILDALVYESYSRDLYEPGRREKSLRRFLSRVFYLFNTNQAAYRRMYSNKLHLLLDSTTGERETLVVALGFHFFTRMLKESRRTDVRRALYAYLGIDGSEQEHVREEARALAKAVDDFIEYNIVANFSVSVVTDIKTAGAAHRGRAYQLYEKVLHAFEKKAYEDIFQVLKEMVREGMLRDKREYHLFYRIFAFSYFEASYPFSFNLSMIESERLATQNRFMYISAFVHRLALHEPPTPLSGEFYRVSLPRQVRNFVAFGMFLYVAAWLVVLLDKLLFQKNLMIAFAEASRDVNQSLHDFALSFHSADAGVITWVLVAVAGLLFYFLVYRLYRLGIDSIAGFIDKLRERSRLFFVAVNVLAFFLCFNLLAETVAFVAAGFKKPAVLYVYSEQGADTQRRDPFVKRFLHANKVYKNFDVKEAELADVVASLKANPTNSPYLAYQRVIVNADPGLLARGGKAPLAAFVTNRLARYAAGSGDLELVFLNRFAYGKVTLFDGLPVLDRLEVKPALDSLDGNPTAIAVEAESISNVRGAPTPYTAGFFNTLKRQSWLSQLLESMRKDKNKISEENRKRLNIAYAYEFLDSEDSRKSAGVKAFTPVPKDEEGKLLGALTQVFRLDGPDATSAFYWSYEGKQGFSERVSKKAGRLSVLAIDERYLTLESGFGEFVREYFFKAGPPFDAARRGSYEQAWMGLFLAFLVLLAAIGWLFSHLDRRARVAVAGASLATLLLGLSPVLGLPEFLGQSDAARVLAFYGHAPNVLFLWLILAFSVFFAGQVAGRGKDDSLRLLVWTVPAAGILHFTLSFLAGDAAGAAAIGDIQRYLVHAEGGIALQLALVLAIAVLSYRFFAFKFRIR